MKYFASPCSLNPIVKVWPNITPVSRRKGGTSLFPDKKEPGLQDTLKSEELKIDYQKD